MGFFSRVKELINLRNTIEEETIKLNELRLNYEKESEKQKQNISNNTKELENLTDQIENKNQTMNNIRAVLEAENEQKRIEIINEANTSAENLKKEANLELETLLLSISEYKITNEELQSEEIRLQREINRYMNQARKFKADIVGIKEFSTNYKDALRCDVEIAEVVIEEAANLLEEDHLLDTIIKLPLHSDNSKELRKLSNATKKEIKNLLETYEARYTTKGNKAIYSLMIIGLQAEMQLLLYKLTYQKLDETKDLVTEIFTKYLVIAGEGNRSILGTITRFISEIQPLYIELVDIEYRYYIKRQQEKEEQRAIKEQMKQEAEERKALEEERKKLDKEESKYRAEMERNKELLEQETDIKKMEQLSNRIKELQSQLNSVEEKKEEVTRLALGKAGYVYVISNLGSFGDDVFKIGMTRRLEPQQRIDELGSASVPFKFDVHAMIFSDDAVSLENTLHKRLSEFRINKVNFRKEFFKSDINSLEILVEEIDPTSEFTKTMYAEEYTQTLAIEESMSVIK